MSPYSDKGHKVIIDTNDRFLWCCR